MFESRAILPRVIDDEATERRPRRHRDVAPWLASLVPAQASIPEDANDFELMDAVEALHRTRAALHLERAKVLARIWSTRGGSSTADEAALREVAMISGVSMAAAERLLSTSLALEQSAWSPGLASGRPRTASGDSSTGSTPRR